MRRRNCNQGFFQKELNATTDCADVDDVLSCPTPFTTPDLRSAAGLADEPRPFVAEIEPKLVSLVLVTRGKENLSPIR